MDGARISMMGGLGSGPSMNRLISSGGDPNSCRPWIGQDGQAYITRMTMNSDGQMVGQPVPVMNANATLLRLEWTLLDQTVIRAALPRLRAVADVRGRGLQMTIPNGFGKTRLDRQAQSDIGPATISMDGLAKSSGDRPIYNLGSIPLPIIHKDFSFSAREIATSRAGNMPLDLTTAELAGRRVAEAAEQLLLGTYSGTYQVAGNILYGMTNFPQRLTKTMTLPTGSNPSTTLAEVLAMRQQSQNALHFGPWVLYTSLSWDQFLDNDYILTGGNVATQTLRQRLRAIEGIEDVVTLDYLKGYDMLLVQQTQDVVREVVGMDISTLQWETQGGMEANFKVMCILVPDVRADFNGNTGIVHGTVSGQTAVTAGVQTVTVGNP